MDQGHRLTRGERSKVRRFVNQTFEAEWEAVQTLRWIQLVYAGLPIHRTYALAYYGAISTTDPLDLTAVRDSPS